MKLLILLFAAFHLNASTCSKTTRHTMAEKQTSDCYKARLAIKGICMNYVIVVLHGDLSKLNIEKSWTDETNGKSYTNVFALGSRCTFQDMSEGAEFYFTLAEKEEPGCNVCMAYRPVPAAKNNIVVRQTPCP